MPRVQRSLILCLVLFWATSVADSTSEPSTRFKLDLDFSNEWKIGTRPFVYKYSKLEIEPKIKRGPIHIQSCIQWDLSQWGQQIWDQAWLGIHTSLWSSRLGLQKSPWGLDSKLGQGELWFDQRSALALHQRKDLDLAGQLPSWMNRFEWKKNWLYQAEFWLGPSEHFESRNAPGYWTSLPLFTVQTQNDSWLFQYLYTAPEMAYNLNLRGDLRRQRLSLHETWIQYKSPLVEFRTGAYLGPNLDTLSAKLYWDDRDFIQSGFVLQSKFKMQEWGLNLGFERSNWLSQGPQTQVQSSLDYLAFTWLALRFGTLLYPHFQEPYINLRVQYHLKYH